MYAAGLATIKAVAFDWARPNYEILIFILGFTLPLIIMGFSYYKIFKSARKHARAIQVNNSRKREFKAAKTIAVVILAFFICWCPFFVLNLLYGIFPTWKVPGELVTVSKWFHYTNSALNPVIYACFNREYRSAFRALLARKRLLYGMTEGATDSKRRSFIPLILSPANLRQKAKKSLGKEKEGRCMNLKESCL